MMNSIRLALIQKTSMMMALCLMAVCSLSVYADTNSDFIKTLGREIAALRMETDPIALENRAAFLNQQIASVKADFHKQAQLIADEKYGVPRLERSLQQNIEMDRNTPSYRTKYGDTDSDETATVRNSLLQARSAAFNAVPSLLLGNSEFQTLLSYEKTLSDLRSSLGSKR